MVERGPSQWPVLFDLAMEIFAQFEENVGFVPSWSFGGGNMLAGVQYTAAMQLIFSEKGSMPPAVNELVSSWRSWNSYAVQGLDVMPLEQAFETFLDGRRTTPMWLEGYGMSKQTNKTGAHGM